MREKKVTIPLSLTGIEWGEVHAAVCSKICAIRNGVYPEDKEDDPTWIRQLLRAQKHIEQQLHAHKVNY